jgi:hypothetical protein
MPDDYHRGPGDDDTFWKKRRNLCFPMAAFDTMMPEKVKGNLWVCWII